MVMGSLSKHKDLGSIHSACVKNWVWLCALAIPVLRRWRPEDP